MRDGGSGNRGGIEFKTNIYSPIYPVVDPVSCVFYGQSGVMGTGSGPFKPLKVKHVLLTVGFAL